MITTSKYYNKLEETQKLTALTEPQWMEDIFELCEAWPGLGKVIII